MTEDELKNIFTHNAVKIIAPAGHGKTEMIVDMVEYATGRQLLLTHTHAGIDSLRKRLKKRKVNPSKYTISTIASFCIKWGNAYKNTARIDSNLSPYNSREESKRYYYQYYVGAKYLFQHEWIGKILQNTYTGVIIDEYQDCLKVHHDAFLIINRYLPLRILCDPLQGIFDFEGDALIDCNKIDFSEVSIITQPWRWINSNQSLGVYLDSIRKIINNTPSNKPCIINLQENNDYLKIINPDDFNIFNILPTLNQYNSVLYISNIENKQIAFSMRSGGVFQVDEKLDCSSLFKYAELFSNNSDIALVLHIINFMSECATKIYASLNSYIRRLKSGTYDFQRIRKLQDFGKTILNNKDKDKNTFLLILLGWFQNINTFKIYRKELYYEMLRSIEYARGNNVPISYAARIIRNNNAFKKSYSGFKYLSSRTLLSKGLEFDCVIIDMSDPLSAKNFYVAATRAMKMIYVISSTNRLELTL